ncbi:TraR/DksA family transcriptional regulator [Chromohalobacter israelensis]
MQERKTRLETLRLELLERIRHYEAHQHRTSGALDKDLDDQALEVRNDEVIARLEDEARTELAQVERALARLDAGVGDHCEICGGLIAPERLEALPYTTRCKACADR